MSDNQQASPGVTPSEAQIEAFVRAYFGADCDGQVGRHIAGLTAALTADPLIAAGADLLRAVRLQHRVIDMLLARMVELDRSFMPTKSEVWPLIIEANAVEVLAKVGS
ncbi:hypothetical protein ACS0Y7_33120 [Burkholderia gladioli]|uniref:hypothetical protein n=1 Tax=Burkholderia gladioli TaxID=28095 RepID=UPI002651DFD4|nr:hypothetical protein [Burkholderia gladioli]MDN7724897.1 hypothetical protein [Burkholderia gladioli]